MIAPTSGLSCNIVELSDTVNGSNNMVRRVCCAPGSQEDLDASANAKQTLGAFAMLQERKHAVETDTYRITYSLGLF